MYVYILKKFLDKRKCLSKSGAAACSLPKCKYFEEMAFLHEKSANKPTESNLSVPEEDNLPEEDISPLSPGEGTSNAGKTPQRKRQNGDATDLELAQSLAKCDAMLKKSLYIYDENEFHYNATP